MRPASILLFIHCSFTDSQGSARVSVLGHSSLSEAEGLESQVIRALNSSCHEGSTMKVRWSSKVNALNNTNNRDATTFSFACQQAQTLNDIVRLCQGQNGTVSCVQIGSVSVIRASTTDLPGLSTALQQLPLQSSDPRARLLRELGGYVTRIYPLLLLRLLRLRSL